MKNWRKWKSLANKKSVLRALLFLPCAALSGYKIIKIVIAPNSYKESLSATEVAQAIEKGSREIFPGTQYVSMPVVDGDEGTVEVMIAVAQGTEHSTWVTGLLGEKVEACWGMSGDGVTAFTEMAAANGLRLVPPEKRNPLITISRGTGELILQALEHGAKRIIIGIDGSVTNDGGADMMQALGTRLCDAKGQEIDHGDGSLSRLSRIDLSAIDSHLRDRMTHMACDVTNPLVVTGEGRIGSQSIHGKVSVGIVRVAKKYRKLVIGITGSLTHDVGVVHQHGIDAVFNVLATVSMPEEAFRGVFDNIYRALHNIAATLQVGMTTEG